ncbi:MAG: nucleoside triphosphate pyrophosphohydrolase [Proteobacteria bacterium]|nr:nucleoside triphosphate pyrophosphohydrolase [Pseudomonadota bacterium]
MIEKKSDITELLALMAQLRDPKQGCAWDIAQTLKTIVPHTLEEAYEVAEAIENGTIEDIKSELGDLLLQIIFYCQIANENDIFDFSSICTELKDKLIRRHPHIFDKKALPDDAKENLWEALKEKERQEKLNTKNTVLGNIPLNLPALSRAQKIQNRAARVGFDWPNIHFVIEKVQEELKEFEQAYASNDFNAAQEELGDILFVCANLARHLKTDAESILRQANRKFERRFNGIEQKVQASGKTWQAFTLEELEEFWNQIKLQENYEKSS